MWNELACLLRSLLFQFRLRWRFLLLLLFNVTQNRFKLTLTHPCLSNVFCLFLQSADIIAEKTKIKDDATEDQVCSNFSFKSFCKLRQSSAENYFCGYKKRRPASVRFGSMKRTITRPRSRTSPPPSGPSARSTFTR